MTDLRARIEQRITDLRVERDIAAAAQRETRGSAFTYVLGPSWRTHIATQDPATTIARIDRELAGCAAVLDLLEQVRKWDDPLDRGDVAEALEAIYPSEESS
jgi:hypothetical protein